MKKISVVFTVLLLSAGCLWAQFSQYPGESAIGYGYDVFGEYASNASSKERVFDLSGTQYNQFGYTIPEIIGVNNMNLNKDYKVIEGSSLKQYSYEMASSVGVGYDGLLFGGSVEARFGKSSTQSSSNYFYTISDVTQAWKVYIKSSKLRDAGSYLTPEARIAINTWSPSEVFEAFGTHVVVSAYFGGRMEMNLTQSFSSRKEAMSIGATVSASYGGINATAEMDQSRGSVNEEMKKNIKILARGGNANYINNTTSVDNQQYNKWAKTIPDIAALVDFEDGSLMPIWELAETASRKRELEAGFKQLLARYPIPEGNGASLMMADATFFIKSKSENLYWDLGGYNLAAARKEGKLGLYAMDNLEAGLQGADRFFKVIPHATDFDYVFLQPQHTDAVVTVHDSEVGYNVQLWDWYQNHSAQMFRMVEVPGERDTYFLESKKNGMYLAAVGAKVTQEHETRLENQKWVFEEAFGETQMAPPAQAVYAIQNVASGKTIDVPGAAPAQKHEQAELQLWDHSEEPDRYFLLNRTDISGKTYFYIQPQHGTEVFDIEGKREEDGTALQLYRHTNESNQQFEFIYAGSPMTYTIRDRNSGKFLDAVDSTLDKNGCRIQIWSANNEADQMWKLIDYHSQWIMPPANVKFLVKSAYSSKFWDIPGTGGATNANGKKLNMWSLDDGWDRMFAFVPSGDNAWLYIQCQNGGKVLDVAGTGGVNGKAIQLWDYTGSNDQKFALQFTSPTTFAVRTNAWKNFDIVGNPSEGDEWKKDGQQIQTYDAGYRADQQFQLIYADGPNKGQVFRFID
ncbi:MAG: RICIN domain-containing protein [Spirochaetales bacterium]|nr:RICIN domain-containing protein [Spirochaetales bacterium]